MKQPVMIHRAIFGSLERFIGIITEHFKGQFPLWLNPVQVGVVPIRPEHNEYAKKLVDELEAAGVRVDCDYTDQNMKIKIKKHKLDRAPYVLVVGDNEAAEGTVAVNVRGGGNVTGVPADAFIASAKAQIAAHELELKSEF